MGSADVAPDTHNMPNEPDAPAEQGTDASRALPSGPTDILLSQVELDAALAAAAQLRAEARAQEKVAPALAAGPAPVSRAPLPRDLGPITQEELDVVQAAHAKSAAPSSPRTQQNEIDELVSSVAEQPDQSVADRTDQPVPEGPSSRESAPVSKQELDQLVRGETAKLLDSTRVAPVRNGGLMSQDEIDRLLAGVPQSAVTQAPTNQPETAPTGQVLEPVPASGVPSDEELNRLLAGADSEQPLDNVELDAPVIDVAPSPEVSLDETIGPPPDEQVLNSAVQDAVLSSASPAAPPAPAILDMPTAEVAVNEATNKIDRESVSLENLAAAAPAGPQQDDLVSQDLIDSLLSEAAQNTEPVAAPTETAPAPPTVQASVAAVEPKAPPQAELANATPNSARYKDDPAIILDPTGMTSRATSKNVQAAAKRYADKSQYYQSILLPEKKN